MARRFPSPGQVNHNTPRQSGQEWPKYSRGLQGRFSCVMAMLCQLTRLSFRDDLSFPALVIPVEGMAQPQQFNHSFIDQSLLNDWVRVTDMPNGNSPIDSVSPTMP
jgi:hypothetical protein